MCTTPDFPFCDVTGFVSGEPGTCIAVTCTPGKFGECRGDQEVRCNATGDNYGVVQCERGCDPSADGCLLCNPGETACTNGKVATCDANGTVISATDCPLGCFEDQPRCRRIDPSNGLGQYIDMVASPPDLDLEYAGFDTKTGVVTDITTGGAIAVPNFAVPAPNGGVPIRVFVANSVRITKVVVSSRTTGLEITGPAFALVARGDISISGLLEADPSAGGTTLPGCTGAPGRMRVNCNYSSSGSGGGAFATNAAKGGDVLNNSEPGGIGGIASGNEKLVPLRGGCASGGVNDDSGVYFDYGSGGGGAIQLVSETKISVDGIIRVIGDHGGSERYEQTSGVVLFGGGSGGAVLLEAPTVELGVNAQLLATGGDGADACMVSGVSCSAGGLGAKPMFAATAGADASCNATSGMPTATGGGGGGLGRARINTADGNYTKASSAVEAASISAGMISTR
jgi:hypothetical protein